ncbi:MAG TPA: hypothetical protein VF898_11850 [Chloroflexota bacterium]
MPRFGCLAVLLHVLQYFRVTSDLGCGKLFLFGLAFLLTGFVSSMRHNRLLARLGLRATSIQPNV